MEAKHRIMISLLVSIPIYLVGAVIIGLSVDYRDGDYLFLELYNWWIWGGFICVSLLFVIFMNLSQIDDKGIVDLFGKSLVFPVIFFGVFYFFVDIFPDPWKIQPSIDVSIFKYHELPYIASASITRYSASEAILYIGACATLLLMLLSIILKVFKYFKSKNNVI